MTPMSTFTVGLEAIASWLMSVLDVLAILVAVLICIAYVEFILERARFARDYTVKMHLSENRQDNLGQR
jgi:hypothetical protein